MKYVITGSLGNISKPLAQKLIAAGNQVTIISSKADKQATIEALGATAAIGSIEDTAFLTQQFKGADAVYTMVPPNFAATNWKGFIASIGKNYAQAIKESGVKNVVNLSSIGAHLPDGCGPVSGLHEAEKALNSLTEINLVHLRPGYFYNNLLSNIALIKNMGIIGSNYSGDSQLVLIHPEDIAQVAFEQLTNLSFKGQSVLYIAGDVKTGSQIAKAIGTAIGKQELPWIEFKDEDSLKGMLGAGLTEEVAKNYVEMGTALRSGKMIEDYVQHSKVINGKIKLEDFAKKFAEIYSAN